jgi:hypothetical protein
MLVGMNTNGNGKLERNQVGSFVFPLVPRRRPTEEQVVGFVKECTCRIDEAGATLAQLYWMLGKALVHLQELPRYGAHGKWEGWLRRWGVSQSRWMRSKRLAESYQTADQLKQVPVDRALKVGAKGRRRVQRALTLSTQSNGKTYEPADGVTMHCCDFRKLKVRDGSAKAIITDPPWSADWLEELPDFARWCARVLRPDGAAVFFYGVQFLPQFVAGMTKHLDWQWMMTGPFQRQGVLLRRVQFVSNYQCALVFGRDRFSLRKPVGDLLPDDGTKDKTLHAWARNPLAVRYCVESFTAKGDLVVDPLAGSFTCAPICLELGRRYLGCDADPACLEAGRTRFNRLHADLYDELTEDKADAG